MHSLRKKLIFSFFHDSISGHKNFPKEGLNRKSASHEVLIRPWRIKKKHIFQIGFNFVEELELQYMP